jgi:hypothetical protein
VRVVWGGPGRDDSESGVRGVRRKR